MTAIALPGLGIESGAKFSPDRRYRYVLWRTWDPSRPVMLVVMLNPSDASESEEDSDPTVDGLIRKASHLGFGGIRIVNLFAWVSSVPARLLDAVDPIGPDNDATILREVFHAKTVVCAWGSHAVIRKLLRLRVIRVLGMLQPIPLKAFIENQDGEPGHPLFLNDQSALHPWPTERT